MCVVTAMVLTMSCSGNKKMNGVLDRVPADADVVVVGNVQTIVESLGGKVEKSKIELPRYVQCRMSQQSSSELKKINRFLKKAHVDLEACAVFADYDDLQSVVVLTVKDKDLFVDGIKSRAYKKIKAECDMDVYAKRVEIGVNGAKDSYNYIALKGSHAYVLPEARATKDFAPVKHLQKVYEEARKKSFAETGYGKYIAKGNAIGISSSCPKGMEEEMQSLFKSWGVVSLPDATVCMRGDLKHDKCVADVMVFDKDGKEMKTADFAPFVNNSSTISKKALAVLGERENILYAVSVKDMDWGRYMDMMADVYGLSRTDRAQLNLVLNYLEGIDGTVALGFGLTNGMQSVADINMGNDMMEQFSATMVIETKDGKAKRAIDDIKGLMEGMSVPFEETDADLTVNLGIIGMSGKLYAKSMDNMLVVSNNPIKENNDNMFVKEEMLTKSNFSIYAKLAKDSKLAKDLKLENDVVLSLYSKPAILNATMAIEIVGDTDTKTGIIHKLMNMVVKANGGTGELK